MITAARNSMDAIYDRIGDGYDTTRRADPQILKIFRELIEIRDIGTYLDVACGTGNYTVALAGIGGNWYAFDQSETMLAEARTKSVIVDWQNHDVENTDFPNDYFDAAMCSLAIHHFQDLSRAFREIARILKPGGRLVIFTSTPEQMAGYWLNEYFPGMMQASCLQMPSLEAIRQAMQPYNLQVKYKRPFFIPPQLQDFCLYSGKQRPDLYLSEDVRRGISSFRNYCSGAELIDGLESLASAIDSGHIYNVIERYENSLGDYLFLVAIKTTA